MDSKIFDNNQNYSAGQRSLICLARVILEKNKILIQDEATAHLDGATDQFVQQVIREQFADCTVLTIAHRLDGVMESDRVLVMDAGKIVEFDHAHRLLQKNDGFLTRLVEETGSENAQQFRKIAQINYEKRVQSRT